MISILLALAAVQAASQGTAAQTAPESGDPMKNCISLVKTNPEQALSTASAWRINGGGLAARQCLGLAYVALERWAPAADAFEQAAKEAQAAGDPRQADLWVQSGNSWLAADGGEKARKAFDLALAASGNLTPILQGEIHLDRARAAVALGDLAAARTDIDKGLKLAPADPFAWYLSAALALREGSIAKANADIAKALELAPNEADILLQAGTIAGTGGDIETAKSYYARAAKAAPNSEAGKAAQAALSGDAAPAATPQQETP